ncbi:ExeM/NucH family extracellular endonuclease [Spirosoma fluminis]
MTSQSAQAAAQPDLTVSLSAPASTLLNQPFAYSLVVSNLGNADASGITTQFELPASVNATYNSSAGASGFTDSQSGNLVTFSGGSLTAGASTTLTVNVTPIVTGNLTSGTALVDPSGAIAESNEGNNSATTVTVAVNAAPAGKIEITEFAYDGADPGGEFIELTNVGNAAVDMTGWSFDDSSPSDPRLSLSGFGLVQPGESVIIAQSSAEAFRTEWFLPASVKILGGNTDNLGRNDAINIYNANGTPVDQLTFNDQAGNGPRTQNASAWTTPANLSATTATAWQLSVAGDAQRSYASATNNVGNPGTYNSSLVNVRVVQLENNTTVTEGGANDTYTLQLTSQPTADVTVTLSAGSRLSVSPNPLTFTPTNYSVAQTVTVTAVNDNAYQGTTPAQITHAVTSSDATYNGFAAVPVSVTVIDNDPQLTASPTIAENTASPYINLPTTGTGYLSGVINDPTDPASTLGIDFTLADTDTDVNSLTLTTSSSNQAVVPTANLNLTGSGAGRNLKIIPTGVGYSDVLVTVTDGSNATSYTISYAASAASTPSSRFHTGASDASTAQAVGADYMLVADDESQRLQLYNRSQSGLPVNSFDFTSSLGLTQLDNGLPREVDIEGSVRVDNRIYWIGSHSNKSDNGNNRPNRSRLFATDVTGSGAFTTLSYVGRYDNLKTDMIAWDQSNGHGLGADYLGLAASTATGVPGENSNGLNIEGLTTSPDNSAAYVAFRAPIEPVSDRTKALIVPVTNFASLVTTNPTTGPATFGAPILLDLGGRGIREIKKNSSNEYVIVAGSFGAFGAAPNDFRLYTWTGNPTDKPGLRSADLSSLGGNDSSIESIVELPSPLTPTSSIQFVLDNGDRVYYNDGTIAKDLSQNNWKKSRSDFATLGAAFSTPTLTANPTTLSNFTATQGTASTLQTYSLTGSDLTADVSVAAPAGYEISQDGTTFANSLTLTRTAGSVNATITTRLSATAALGVVNGTVTNISGSASTDVAVSGTVNALVIPSGNLATWTFEGSVNTPASVSANATAGNATFTGVTNITFPAGYNPTPGAAYSAEGWSTGGLDPGKYIQFTITPNSGYALNVTGIGFTERRSGTGVRNAQVRYSIDGNTFFDAGSEISIPDDTNPRSQTAATSLSNIISPVTFRIYGYASEATGGTWRFDNVSITGSVVPNTTPFIAALPNPVSLSYTVGSGPASEIVTVSAGNLSPAAGLITATASSTAFAVSPASVAYSASSLANTLFSVSLVSELSVGSYAGTITFTGGGATATVAVTGTVSNTTSAAGITLISAIQGTGTSAALTGTRTIEGVVTRVFPGSTGLNSFYVQEEDADSDGNPATSEAITVYDPSGFFMGSVGTKVRVTGSVGEFASNFDGVNSSLTQLTLTAAASLTNLGTSSLPTITTITLPVASRSDLERYESMLVQLQAATGNLTVTDNFYLGRFGQVTLAATDPTTNQPGTDPRIEQYTQFNAPSASGNAAYLAAVARRLIILDDASGLQNPPTIIHARGGNPLSASNTLRAGDDVASITGVLDERFDGYRIQTNTPVNFNPTSPRLTTPPAVGGSLRVAGFNVLNYFTDLDSNPASNNPIVTVPNGGSVSFEPRGAETAEEFTRQRDKIITAITAINPDVLGVIEMENNGTTAIQNLVDGLNAVSGAGSFTFVNDANLVNDPNPAPNAVGTDAIKVALIYKPASVTPLGLPISSSDPVFDRPPVAQSFQQNGNGAKFSVIVNHFKSKGSGSGADADQNDGQGASNNRRVQQANALIAFVPSVTATAGDPDVLMLGDFNSYAQEDPIRSLTAAGYTSLRPASDYSYSFDGQFGFLDYAFANASMLSQVTGSADWHINSDEPIVLDYNTNFKQSQSGLYAPDPFKASDHDPVVVGLNLTSLLSATLVASTSVCTGSPANLSLTVAGLNTGQTYSYTISNGTNSTTASGVSATAVVTSVVVTEPGAFTATVLTSANISTTVASGNVTINTLPTNASLTSGTLTCTTPSATLTASATGGTSYTLLGGGASSQTNTTGMFTISREGSYTAVIANASGCTTTAVATVSSNTSAPTNASLTSGTLTCSVATVNLTASATGGTSYTLSNGQSSQVNTTGQFVVSTPGTYTATISNGSGCTTTATATVSSALSSAVSLSNTSPLSFTNATVTLTASGGSSYTFSTGAAQQGGVNGATATVTTAGVFSVTARDANGCTASASTTVTGGNSPTVCRSASAVINVVVTGMPVRYEWFKNSLTSPKIMETPQLFRGTATSSLTLINAQSNTQGNFYLKVTDQSGTVIIYGPYRLTVDASCRAREVAQLETPLQVEIAPNPIQLDQLRAVVRGAEGRSLQVKLLDLRGHLVRQQHWQQAEAQQLLDWDMQAQTSGIYHLLVVSEAGDDVPAQRLSIKVVKP